MECGETGGEERWLSHGQTAELIISSGLFYLEAFFSRWLFLNKRMPFMASNSEKTE